MTQGVGGLPPAPVNVPQGQAMTPGVQPGVTNAIVIADKIIIFGPSTGWFIYDGTPALGNPPVAFGTAGGTTTDPYGNILPGLPSTQGSVVAVGPGEVIQMADGALFFQATPPPANAFAGAMSCDGTAGFLGISSGTNSATDIFSELFLNSAANGGVVQAVNGVDSQVYDVSTIRKYVTSPPFTVNSLTSTPIPGMAVTLGVATYRIRARLFATQGGVTASQAVGISGAGGLVLSAADLGVTGWDTTVGGGGAFGSITELATLGSRAGIGAPTTGHTFIIDIDGSVTVSTAGTLDLTASCVTAAADTWQIRALSCLEASPVG